MIQAKAFELRDSMTFIPIIAVLVDPAQPTEMGMTSEKERWLLRRCGYTPCEVNVLLMDANGSSCKQMNGTCSPQDWNDRTYQTAHNYIRDNWKHLKDGQVICVETILGERSYPKESEYVPYKAENEDE